MGKLATMILWGSLKLGVPLLASLLFFQTGCLYLTTVYADFEPDIFNHHHVSQVTQGYFEPYLVNYYDETSPAAGGDGEDDEDEESLLDDGGNNASGKVRQLNQFHESGSDNAIIIQDFISLSSSKVLMKVKGSESGDNHPDDILQAYSSKAGESGSVVISEKDQVHRLEKKLLGLFGMTKRPKRKGNGGVGKRSVPKELLDLYEKQTNTEFHTTDLFLPGKFTRNANTVRVINPHEATLSNQPSQLHAILKFDLSPNSIPVNEKITGAELRLPFSITLPSSKDSSHSEKVDIVAPSVFARVLLHDIIKPPPKRPSKDSLQQHNGHQNKPITHVIDSKLVNLTNRKYPTFWLTFDILPAVLRWMGIGSTGNLTTANNYGVALEIVGLKGEKHEEIKGVQEFNMKLKDDKEFISLFLYSDDGHNAKAAHRGSRSKREATNKSGNKKSSQRKLRRAAQHHYHHQQQYYRNHNQHHYHHQQYGSGGRRRKPHRYKNRRRNLCSRKPMFVDFTDVGWTDWILAPPGYQAYYCSGECPFPMSEHLNATNHAVIQALINSMNPSLVPPPCCVPNKYSSLSLLYTDSSDRIVLKNYNEMVVDSCGCS